MHQIAEIWHFFEIYEALAPDKSAETRGWEGRRKAIEALEDAQRRYTEQLSEATTAQG
jgi:inorganic pyrophosphatase